MGVRRYKQGDETGILTLFEKVFNSHMEYNFWKWKYIDHPDEMNPFIFVFEDDGEILGHISLWVHQARINGKHQKIGLRIDTMVDPTARGRGIYKQLNERMVTDAKQADIALLYGFPAEKAKELLIEYTESYHISNVDRWVYMNKPITTAASKIKPLKMFSFLDKIYYFSKRFVKGRKNQLYNHIEKINRFDGQFTMKPLRESIYLQRDANYLNWRYVDHPTNNYDILQWTENDSIKGYIVYRIATNQQGIRIGFIVDLIAFGESYQTIEQSLLQQAINNMEDTAFIQVWALPNQQVANTFKKAGFFLKDHPMPLVVTQITNDSTNFKDPTNWFISMGDVDSF